MTYSNYNSLDLVTDGLCLSVPAWSGWKISLGLEMSQTKDNAKQKTLSSK